VICWSCERATGEGVTCAKCGAIQPPDLALDFFGVLGVPRKYSLDLGAAEARFKELSRQLHPDRFAKADPRARRASLQQSVLLNEAWRTIRDPVRRAEYLLRLVGREIDPDEGRARRVGLVTGATTKLTTRTLTSAAADVDEPAPRERMSAPAALLGEVLDLREELAQARADGDDARVVAMATDIRGRIDVALGRVAAALGRAELENAVGPPEWEAAARELIAVRYFRRFLDEVAVHEEAIAARATGASLG
jgi:molecular chaperone HscB